MYLVAACWGLLALARGAVASSSLDPFVVQEPDSSQAISCLFQFHARLDSMSWTRDRKGNTSPVRSANYEIHEKGFNDRRLVDFTGTLRNKKALFLQDSQHVTVVSSQHQCKVYSKSRRDLWDDDWGETSTTDLYIYNLVWSNFVYDFPQSRDMTKFDAVNNSCLYTFHQVVDTKSPSVKLSLTSLWKDIQNRDYDGEVYLAPISFSVHTIDPPKKVRFHHVDMQITFSNFWIGKLKIEELVLEPERYCEGEPLGFPMLPLYFTYNVSQTENGYQESRNVYYDVVRQIQRIQYLDGPPNATNIKIYDYKSQLIFTNRNGVCNATHLVARYAEGAKRLAKDSRLPTAAEHFNIGEDVQTHGRYFINRTYFEVFSWRDWDRRDREYVYYHWYFKYPGKRGNDPDYHTPWRIIRSVRNGTTTKEQSRLDIEYNQEIITEGSFDLAACRSGVRTQDFTVTFDNLPPHVEFDQEKIVKAFRYFMDLKLSISTGSISTVRLGNIRATRSDKMSGLFQVDFTIADNVMMNGEEELELFGEDLAEVEETLRLVSDRGELVIICPFLECDVSLKGFLK